MSKLISHRGNTRSAIPEYENHPNYIDAALNLGLDVEVDVWVMGERIFLGHDEPQFPVKLKFLQDRSTSLWVHCKNSAALRFFSEFDLNYFFHANDKHTITSKGYIWSRPSSYLFAQNEVLVMPEKSQEEMPKESLEMIAGICSDLVLNYL